MIMEKNNFPVQWRGTILEMVLVVACLLLFISYSNKLGTYHPILLLLLLLLYCRSANEPELELDGGTRTFSYIEEWIF